MQMMTSVDARREMENLLVEQRRSFHHAGRFHISPFTAYRVYRGKERFVVGYSWSRPYSHYSKGIVYECVLGWGDCYETAINKARDSLL